jgi:hypothetical protein
MNPLVEKPWDLCQAKAHFQSRHLQDRYRAAPCGKIAMAIALH